MQIYIFQSTQQQQQQQQPQQQQQQQQQQPGFHIDHWSRMYCVVRHSRVSSFRDIKRWAKASHTILDDPTGWSSAGITPKWKTKRCDTSETWRWNLNITQLKKKIIFQAFIVVFHV